MAIREIRKVGDPCLSKICDRVEEFGTELAQLLEDLQDTLLTTTGVGIAAPQIGELKRVIVTKDIDTNKIEEYVNIEILEQGDETERSEGCLSVPNLIGKVMRPEFVKIRAQDRYGETFEKTILGIMARVISHELDHLDGHIYTEFATETWEREEVKVEES